MQSAVALVLGLGCAAGAFGQDAPAKRYGIAADLKTYPQAMPKEALASVVKAIEGRHIDYLLAQLADPPWVDRRVEGNGGSFDELVKETAAKLVDDPGALKRLRRALQEGEWQTDEASAVVRLKEGDMAVFFRKAGGRWYMENRKK